MANSLCLVIPEGSSEAIIELQRYDRLRKLVEISSENIRRIMDSVAGPIEAFAIAIWRVELLAKLLDTLFRAAKAEDTLDIGR